MFGIFSGPLRTTLCSCPWPSPGSLLRYYARVVSCGQAGELHSKCQRTKRVRWLPLAWVHSLIVHNYLRGTDLAHDINYTLIRSGWRVKSKRSISAVVIYSRCSSKEWKLNIYFLITALFFPISIQFMITSWTTSFVWNTHTNGLGTKVYLISLPVQYNWMCLTSRNSVPQCLPTVAFFVF
jgi:hypothetical protein